MKPAAQRLINRLAGLLLLVVFVVGQVPVLPLIVSAVAALDGEHGVELASARGGFKVTLTHHRGSGVHHHRGLVSILAGPESGDSRQDHQFLFMSSGGAAAELNTDLSSAAHPVTAALPAPAWEIAAACGQLDRAAVARRETSRPWLTCASRPEQRCGRCVVMLI